MVQQADEGGDFDFAPFIRTRCGGGGGDAENFARVRELFDGAYAGRRTTRAEAGTIQLFNGCRPHCPRRALHSQNRVVFPSLS